MKEKNIVLFVGDIPNRHMELIEELKKEIDLNFKIVIIIDNNAKLQLSFEYQKKVFKIIRCDSNNKKEISKKLNFIKKDVLMIFYIYESDADFYCEVLKNIKIKNTPSIESIRKSTDKIKMRKAFYKYGQDMIPKFMLIKSKDDLELISKK